MQVYSEILNLLKLNELYNMSSRNKTSRMGTHVLGRLVSPGMLFLHGHELGSVHVSVGFSKHHDDVDKQSDVTVADKRQKSSKIEMVT